MASAVEIAAAISGEPAPRNRRFEPAMSHP
jgi:hypothetical protein